MVLLTVYSLSEEDEYESIGDMIGHVVEIFPLNVEFNSSIDEE
jgi:hypothetical protein